MAEVIGVRRRSSSEQKWITKQYGGKNLDLQGSFDIELGYRHRLPLSRRTSRSLGMAEVRNSE